MKAGDLDRRIKLLAPVQTKTAAGQRIDTFEVYAEAWANVQQIGGREQLRAGRETSPSEYSIRLRYRQDVKYGHRIQLVDTGDMLTVSVPQLDRKNWTITITATGVTDV